MSATVEKSKKYTIAFRGLNYGEGYQDGEFSDCLNVSSALYPCLTQRSGRTEEGTYDSPTTLHAKDGLLVIDGTRVLYKGNEVGHVARGRKQIATVGNYVIIFPDKVFYNVETGEFGHMEVSATASAETSGAYVEEMDTCYDDLPYKGDSGIGGKSFVYARSVTVDQATGLVSISGKKTDPHATEVYDIRGKYIQFTDDSTVYYIHPDAEYYTVNWTETGDNGYDDDSADYEEWEMTLTDYYIAGGCYSSVGSQKAPGLTFTDSTITTTGDDFTFRVGDAVTIEGCTANPENNKTIIVRGVSSKVLTFYENSFTAGEERGAVTIKREVPDLDFICESNYRLWGTKGNTIYGSKYGDPFNFNVFDGLTGDSYYIDVASDGEFTGCVPYSSHICFFKENTLHKLYGSKPSNYQLVTSQVYGVQAGSERSMCIINETLFYKSANGVYAYTGGVPEKVSDKFGIRRFSDACAATDGTRYYLSMRSGEEWTLFVYDVQRGLWMQEDDLNCVDMTFHDGHVYLLAADGGLFKIDESADKSNIEWSVTFCPFDETVNERKGYSAFHLRMDLAAGAWLNVEIKRNTDTRWDTVYTTHNERARTITVPVLPARCDSVEIRLSGKGECMLRTLIREFHTGSDV